MQDIAAQVAVVFVLILINGFFSMAEIALISVRRSAMQTRAEAGSRGARTVLELTENPTRLLATIQVAITLVGTFASATAAVTLATPIQRVLEGLGITWVSTAAAGLALFLVTLAISYFTLVLGELVPKRLGLSRAERVAEAVSRPIAFFAMLFSPVVWLLTGSTSVVTKLIGAGSDVSQQGVSEEEIKLLVTEQGSLLAEEKQMITQIFDIGDTVAREIMVPRVDVSFVEDTFTVNDAVDILHARGYSRAPVFHDSHDTVVGVVFLKDLVGPVREGKLDHPVTDFLRTPVFTPETKQVLQLLDEMQTSHNQMAVVVDEYGGTAGIVTIEDIIEEVVGEIADEFDRDKQSVVKLSDSAWTVEGSLPVEDAIEMGFPVAEAEGFDTLAGWLLEQLGHIPHAGERVERGGYTFVAQNVRRRRIARILVEAPEMTASADSDMDGRSTTE